MNTTAKVTGSIVTSALFAIASAIGVGHFTADAEPHPNSVLFGDSVTANPTIPDGALYRFVDTIPKNGAGCPSDGHFADAMSRASGLGTDNYTCAGASLRSGGLPIREEIDKAGASGDLSDQTQRVVIMAGYNDTYQHPELNGDQIYGLIHDGLVDAVNQARHYAPHARITLAGYPSIGNQNGEVCLVNVIPNVTWPTWGVNNRDVENMLETAGQNAAHETGAEFLSIKDMSRDHNMCTNDRWMTGVVDTTAQPHNMPLHLTNDGLEQVGTFVGQH